MANSNDNATGPANLLNTISYNDFLAKVNQKQIDMVIYDAQAPEIECCDKAGEHYRVSNPRTPDFKEFLLQNDINVQDVTLGSSNGSKGMSALFSIVIAGGIVAFLAKRPFAQTMGGSPKVKSLKTDVTKPSEKVSFLFLSKLIIPYFLSNF